MVQGRLRVNVDPWIARLVLALHLSTFLAAHPLLSLEMLVRDSLGDLVSEGVDVAVRFGEPEASSLIARKLPETRIVACAAQPTLPTTAGHGTRDLAQHECLPRSRHRPPFPWEFHRAGKVVEEGEGQAGAKRPRHQAYRLCGRPRDRTDHRVWP